MKLLVLNFLPLTLFVFRILLVDDKKTPFPAHDFAFGAAFLDGSPRFHLYLVLNFPFSSHTLFFRQGVPLLFPEARDDVPRRSPDLPAPHLLHCFNSCT